MANSSLYAAFERMWQHVTSALSGKAEKDHTHGSYVNQNAFSNVKVGSTTVAAESTTDTLELVAGTNVTITPDATNDKITITAKDTVYTHPSHTAKSNGFYKVTVDGSGHVSGTSAVTKSDITDLGIPAQDTVYTHPTHTAKESGLYKVTVDSEGHVSAATAVTKSDITALGIPAQDTTYTLPSAGSSLGGVKSGGDVTISSGVITVKDDSHNHVISNVDGLQSALDAKLDTSLKGAASGLAELDSTGKVPASQLPSYVDDVVEGTYASSTSFKDSTGTAVTGETGKIYVDTTSNKTYRWSGSAFVEISSSLALGTTSSTAYRGDRGKTAYDHSQITTGNPHGTTKSDLGLGNVENKSSATIRSELTKSDVTTALGFTPPSNLSDLGITATATELNYVDGVTSNIQTQLDGKAASSHGTHVTYSTTAPKANGTASAGSASSVSRSDHVHPLQTTVSGNAGSATKLQTARTITLSGDVSGSVSFDGSDNVTITTTVADDSHAHIISNVDGLQSALDAKVPTSRTVNGKALSANITLSASDVSAYSKTEIDSMSFITVDDIDTICGVNA